MSYWNEPLIIANHAFPRFIGGPLDGITDSPFRRLVREFSTHELLYSEMRHAACIAPGGVGSQRALKFASLERPLNFQIAASTTVPLAKALERIMQAGVDFVDLNVGCPAKNVIHSGSGSALMADPERLKSILHDIQKYSTVPFTVKIRSGFKQENAVTIAQMIQDAGASALAIHPRLQTQKFQGQPDYDVAARVKRAVNIPVILSGNIVNWQTAKMAYERTGVDGFLIGRALWSRPWKLHELYEHSQGREYLVNSSMRIATALKHIEYMMDYYGPHGIYTFRKYLPLYIHGVLGATNLRTRLMVSTSIDEVREGLLSVVQ